MGQFFRTKWIMGLQLLLCSALIFFLVIATFPRALAAEAVFPILPGLEGAVEFWKQIFTRYGASEVVFLDPGDHGRIYSVLRGVPEGDEGRVVIERERARIVAEHDLNEPDGRVRSQRGVKEQFISGLRISGRYMPQMRKIFRDEGLPVELAYLPLVESSFNVRARSGAGAVGMWQFMPETGKKFLLISDAVDERRDPLVSTRAAARLLKQNHRLLGNWPLAVTAYNHGTEGIFRAMDTVGTQDLMEIIRRYQSPTFGFASKNFYAEFLAAVSIAKNSDAYFPSLRPYSPLNLREIEIKRPLPIHSLLRPTAVSHGDFLEWNPAISPAASIIPAGYRVKVPPEKADRFAIAQRRMLETQTEKKAAAVTKPTNGGSRSGKTVSSSQKAVSRAASAARQASRSSGSKGITVTRSLKVANR
jgi:membrane-bound lytic murein transglycosylase D